MFYSHLNFGLIVIYNPKFKNLKFIIWKFNLLKLKKVRTFIERSSETELTRFPDLRVFRKRERERDGWNHQWRRRRRQTIGGGGARRRDSGSSGDDLDEEEAPKNFPKTLVDSSPALSGSVRVLNTANRKPLSSGSVRFVPVRFEPVGARFDYSAEGRPIVPF